MGEKSRDNNYQNKEMGNIKLKKEVKIQRRRIEHMKKEGKTKRKKGEAR